MLPRSGEELANWVSILLKTSDAMDTKEGLARFIHQAFVRRDVVVELIANANARGHRAYNDLDMDKVRAKARAVLPECGIMPEIAKLMPLDAQLDEIQIPKAATPVPLHKTLDEVASAMAVEKPNGVV